MKSSFLNRVYRAIKIDPDLYEEVLSEAWELKLGGSSLVCEAYFEIYSRDSLARICNEVPLAEAGGEIELF